jgi:hypothetical protein
MSEPFLHPILWRKDRPCYQAGIFDATGTEPVDPAEFIELHQHSTLGLGNITYSLEEHFARLEASERYRKSLGIPDMNYLAYSFNAGYNVEQVIALIEKCRELGYEVRGWFNEESAMMVIAAATYDLTEDSGWELYEWAKLKGNCPSDSYGHASWYEFCLFGIPIYDTWALQNTSPFRNGKLIAVSPDGQRIAFFGP